MLVLMYAILVWMMYINPMYTLLSPRSLLPPKSAVAFPLYFGERENLQAKMIQTCGAGEVERLLDEQMLAEFL